MIKTWVLEKFKSVYDRTELEIAPLTIFAGANSSGKSTLIQSILLTAQTVQSALYPRCVILNGDIVRMGGFDDILSDGSDSKLISVGFSLIPQPIEEDGTIGFGDFAWYHYPIEYLEHIKGIKCNFSFSSTGPDEQREVLQLQPVLERCEITLASDSTKESEDLEVVIQKRRTQVAETLNLFDLNEKSLQRTELASLDYEVIRPFYKPSPSRRAYSSGQPDKAGRLAGAYVRHFLPDQLSVVYDVIEAQAERTLDRLSEFANPRYTGLPESDEATLQSNFSLRKIILDALEASLQAIDQFPMFQQSRLTQALDTLKVQFSTENLQKLGKLLPPSARRNYQTAINSQRTEIIAIIRDGRDPEYRVAPTPLSDEMAISVSYIQNFFSQRVKYLGPLRDEPKPVYPLAGASDPSDVGFKGEHTAAVLDVHRNTIISYIASSVLTDQTLDDAKVTTTSLLTAVLDWLRYMGIARNVRTVDKGKLGHELKITTAGEQSLHDLTHVGVGVSQVLPILVLSLLAERGSTLIFEQPELHLHPRVQTRLADFFVSLIIAGKQCIVETHSEYLINRLRYLAASTGGTQIPDAVQMYFVEKHQERSVYRPVRINRFGVIPDWPDGFFDENEAIAAAVLNAATSKRKKEKRQ